MGWLSPGVVWRWACQRADRTIVIGRSDWQRSISRPDSMGIADGGGRPLIATRPPGVRTGPRLPDQWVPWLALTPEPS